MRCDFDLVGPTESGIFSSPVCRQGAALGHRNFVKKVFFPLSGHAAVWPDAAC